MYPPDNFVSLIDIFFYFIGSGIDFAHPGSLLPPFFPKALAMVNRPNTECVRVVVRCRPLSRKEIEQGRQQIVDMDLKAGQVTLRNPKLDISEPRKSFTFDSVHDWK